MDHVYAGERAVKAERDLYLPPTAGHRANGFGRNALSGNAASGEAAYQAYMHRAVFYGFTRDAVAGLLGLIHRKPGTVVVPPALEPMLDSMTAQGESVHLLWRRITEAQLRKSRLGLLVDMPSGGNADALPYVALYDAQSVINWDDGIRDQGRQALELVVLDESGFARAANFQWDYRKQYRVLAMSNVVASITSVDQDASAEGVYMFGVASDRGEVPAFVSSMTLDAIPFVFVNANDTCAEPDQPALLNLANLDLAVYRGQADYRQALYLQGQDTLVCVGRTKTQMDLPVGAGAVLDVPAGGDAKFIGVAAAGIGEQRQALEADIARAMMVSVQMLDTSGGAESGEALRVRVSARTASLASLQHTAAQAIKDCLVHAGKWLRLPDSDLEMIEVTPNLDFAEGTVDASSVNALIDAIAKGAPLSMRSFHAWLQQKGYTTKDFDQEMLEVGEDPGVDESAGVPAVDPVPDAGGE